MARARRAAGRARAARRERAVDGLVGNVLRLSAELGRVAVTIALFELALRWALMLAVAWFAAGRA